VKRRIRFSKFKFLIEIFILFILKKDRDLRLYVDYCSFNKITVKNKYTLFLIGEFIDRLYGAAIYIKLDIRNIYYRIQIRFGDEWKTAFRTRYGHYKYIIIFFSLINAPATF
jgi:hypothetical protein